MTEESLNQEQASTKAFFMSAFEKYRTLWPCLLGLVFSRAGLIVSSYGSYTSTDEGIFTDGSMLLALSVLAILFFILNATKKTVPKRAVNTIAKLCFAVEAATLFGLTFMAIIGYSNDMLRLFISAVSTFTASGAIFYWLRRVRGSSSATAAVFTFTALLISEIEIYICGVLPIEIGYALAGVLALMQYPCILWARSRMRAYEIATTSQVFDYFKFAKSGVSNTRYLIATAVGIGCLSFVIGMLRGYPNGEPIEFSAYSRLAYCLLTMGISAALVIVSLRGRHNAMTIGIWIVMQVLACLALISYAAFPGYLEIGALYTTTLNAMMVGFTWYIVIAFMSFGWRDPYYYAIAGWLVWLGSRAVARILLMGFYPFSENDMLMNALIASLLMLSTQVIFVQFFNTLNKENEARGKEAAIKRSKLERLMGLDENESLSEMRQSTMQHSAEELGKQFMLSDREVEVLTLYALGFTQKRVAEELFITQSTTHAHIKRIYTKTGLHSRQEILDYMKNYTS